MSYRRNWISITLVIITLVIFIPVARPQQQDVEFIDFRISNAIQ
jgi:hypothetical protein